MTSHQELTYIKAHKNPSPYCQRRFGGLHMTKHLYHRTLAAVFLLGVSSVPGMAQDASLDALWDDATIHGNARYRYEFVDQDGLPRNANASTLRARLGVTSGSFAGFSFKLEGEGIINVGKEKFNDTLNGRIEFPVVADPEDAVLNQAYLRWEHNKQVDAKVGRQVLNLDNQRWIGSVGWRQNDQTLDAAFISTSPVKGAKVEYGYVWRVNRIFGPDSPNGIWRDNDIHLIRASYDIEGVGTLSTFGYLLDIPNAPAASNKTFGVRLNGKRALDDSANILYAVEYGRQSEHGDNPNEFGLDYVLLNPGFSYGPFTAKFGYERLEGNGTVALQTPLATLHAFNGWADVFLTTPANGLEDIYGDVTFKPTGPEWLKGTVFRALYHDFSATRAGLDYGSEFDALISRKIGKYLTLTAKYADYQSDGFATDRQKLWLMVEAAF